MSQPYQSPDEILELVESCAGTKTSNSGNPKFAQALGLLAYKNVFENIWMRPGLDRRSRSLVTLGMLMALRAADEMKIHTLMAVKNGVSVGEIEEILYQGTSYLGFPAVNLAATAAAEALAGAGLLDERD